VPVIINELNVAEPAVTRALTPADAPHEPVEPEPTPTTNPIDAARRHARLLAD